MARRPGPIAYLSGGPSSSQQPQQQQGDLDGVAYDYPHVDARIVRTGRIALASGVSATQALRRAPLGGRATVLRHDAAARAHARATSRAAEGERKVAAVLRTRGPPTHVGTGAAARAAWFDERHASVEVGWSVARRAAQR